MNIPPIKDLDTALFIYYNYPEIGTAQIKELFEGISKSTVTKLKNAVKQSMIDKGIKSHVLHSVNTHTAYETWGIDINDIENRRKKLQELNL